MFHLKGAKNNNGEEQTVVFEAKPSHPQAKQDNAIYPLRVIATDIGAMPCSHTCQHDYSPFLEY